MEACEVCGFQWDAITADELPERLRQAALGFETVLRAEIDALQSRPDATTWSAMEYGGHVRDVLFNLRDRMILGLAQDNPTPHSMFNDVRIANGLYVDDDPATLATEINIAAGLLARTVEALSAEQLARPVFYPWPTPATRTLLWVAAQALHEAEHHLTDVRALVPLPTTGLEILLTGPATPAEPAVFLTINKQPHAGVGFIPAVTIHFADGTGGGGGGSSIFDTPYVEQMVNESSGRMWAFGLAPKECVSVTVGSVTRATIVADNLSLNAFMIETPIDEDEGESANDTITFHYADGTQQHRDLQSFDDD